MSDSVMPCGKPVLSTASGTLLTSGGFSAIMPPMGGGPPVLLTGRGEVPKIPPVRCPSGPAGDDGPKNEPAGGRGVPVIPPTLCSSGLAGDNGLTNAPAGG